MKQADVVSTGRRPGSRGRRAAILAIALPALALALSGGGSAGTRALDLTPPPPPPHIPTATPKLGGALAQLSTAASARGAAAALAAAHSAGAPTSQGRALVIVQPSKSVTAAETAIAAAGGTVDRAYGGLVQAYVAPGGLTRLASNSAVTDVQAPDRP